MAVCNVMRLSLSLPTATLFRLVTLRAGGAPHAASQALPVNTAPVAYSATQRMI